MPDRIATELVEAIRETRAFLEDQTRLGLKEITGLPSVTLPAQDDTAEPQEKALPTTLAAVAEAVKACSACPLAGQGDRLTGAGPDGAPLVVAVPAPARIDLEQGRLLSGEAGKLFDAILFAFGFTRDQVYVTSLVKCPQQGPLTASELTPCLEHFRQELACCPEAPVVLMGADGGRWLWPEGSQKESGWSRWEDRAFRLTHHPAELLRNPALKPQVWEDLRELGKASGR